MSEHTPLVLHEGFSITHDSTLLTTTYIDFRMPHERSDIGAIIKYSPQEFALENCKTIKLARPSHFRQEGETLIQDTGEGLATKETVIQTKKIAPDSENISQLTDKGDINRVLELSESNMRLTKRQVHTSGTRTVTDRNWAKLEWGEDTWIFCAAMEPKSQDDCKVLQESLAPDYDSISYIQSPRDFALMLGRAYIECYGVAQAEKEEVTHKLGGAILGTTYHDCLYVAHGPVVYVEDTYETYSSALNAQHPLETILLPIFTKNKQFIGQREYRFVLLDKREHHEDFKILPMTLELLGTIGSYNLSKGPMLIPEINTSDAEPVPPAKTEITGLSRFPNFPMEPIKLTDIARQNADTSNISNRHKLHESEELPEDYLETVGVYSAVATLKEKVDHPLLGVAGADAKRRPEVSSAAWYSERAIRKLCNRFSDCIVGISITDDNYIIINVQLDQWKNSECKLAIGPSGAYALNVKSDVTGRSFSMYPGMVGENILSNKALEAIANIERDR